MEHIEHILMHAIEHSLADTLYLIPFLFVTYLAMEWLEHKTSGKTIEAVKRAGAAGPVAGAFLGALPQCGFSAAAATLYAARVVTLGTVFAVFLSTSDEMLPIFIASQVPALTIAKILGAKIVIGMVMGFVVDAVLRIARRDAENLRIHELCEQDGCSCGRDCATCSNNPELVYGHHDDKAHHDECAESVCGHAHEHSCGHARDHEPHACDHGRECGHDREHHAHDHEHHAHDHGRECGHDREHRHGYERDHEHGRGRHHDHDHDHRAHDHEPCHAFACEEASCMGHNHDHSGDFGFAGVAKSALIHTAQVTLFVFAITFVLNGVLELVGEDVLAKFLSVNSAMSVFASALVGLIPNCAGSVAIAQLYLEGVLGPGAMIAGLLVSAGVGLLILVRSNRSLRGTLAIVIALYATGVFWGLLFNVLGIAF